MIILILNIYKSLWRRFVYIGIINLLYGAQFYIISIRYNFTLINVFFIISYIGIESTILHLFFQNYIIQKVTKHQKEGNDPIFKKDFH